MSQPPSTAPEPPPLESSPARWFADEVHPHGAQLKSYLRGTFPAVRDVDDVVQESFLRIWQARAAHPIKSAKAFLYTVARHLALDEVRRSKISPVILVRDLAALPVSEDKPSIQELLSRQEKLTLLAQAIVSLPTRMREVVILHKIEGLTQFEVAQKLGLAPKTVDNLVTRGVKRCREFLRHRGVEHF